MILSLFFWTQLRGILIRKHINENGFIFLGIIFISHVVLLQTRGCLAIPLIIQVAVQATLASNNSSIFFTFLNSGHQPSLSFLFNLSHSRTSPLICIVHSDHVIFLKMSRLRLHHRIISRLNIQLIINFLVKYLSTCPSFIIQLLRWCTHHKSRISHGFQTADHFLLLI